MNWVVLSYSLASTGSNSSSRVAVWRRLKRFGVISPVGGLQVLPAREDCIEAFQWLAQEIRQDGGEALIIHVDQFEGLKTEDLIALFCEARAKEYEEIQEELEQMRSLFTTTSESADTVSARNDLSKIRKQFNEIKAIDYFNCAKGIQLEQALDQVQVMLSPKTAPAGDVSRVNLELYRGRRWVTRPRPHVDRLASIWLVRQFIDPKATVRYSHQPEGDEVAFDMEHGEFTHYGSLCTFETMLHAFDLEQITALHTIAEIVHEIDLRDGIYNRPETAGVDVVLQGWLLNNLSDQELEQHGVVLFAGLYSTLQAK